jgi:hypothetical protein
MVQDRTLCVWLLERYSETLAVQEKFGRTTLIRVILCYPLEWYEGTYLLMTTFDITEKIR